MLYLQKQTLMAPQEKIVIVGAGMAGLTAAWYLKKAGKDVLILEAANHIGGRVHTEYKDGYTLDRGFQVLLTAYPEAQRALDYNALNLKTFIPGSIILGDKGRTFIGDPVRYPLGALATAFSWAASFKDKLNIKRLTNEVKAMSIDDIFSQERQIPTLQYLREYGFSDQIIQHFFKPFYGGIFLERALNTPHPMFLFTMKMFAEGNAAIPEKGMGAIPKQLASILNEDDILLNTKVVNFDMQYAIDQNDNAYPYSHLIIATPALVKEKQPTGYQTTTQLYFSSKFNPFNRNAIALNGMENNTFNNLAVLTNLYEGYAPKGDVLISVSVPGDHVLSGMRLDDQVRQEMQAYCPRTHDWKCIDSYTIEQALPKLERLRNSLHKEDYMIGKNVYLCGDYLLNGSLNAAMKTGRVVAENIIEAD